MGVVTKKFEGGVDTVHVEEWLRSMFQLCRGGLVHENFKLDPGRKLLGGRTYVFMDFVHGISLHVITHSLDYTIDAIDLSYY